MKYRLLLFLWVTGSFLAMDQQYCNGNITYDPFKRTIALESRQGDMFTKITRDEHGFADISYCRLGSVVSYQETLPYCHEVAKFDHKLCTNF